MDIFKKSKQKKINKHYREIDEYRKEVDRINDKLSKSPNTDEYFSLKFKKENILKKIDELCIEINKLKK